MFSGLSKGRKGKNIVMEICWMLCFESYAWVVGLDNSVFHIYTQCVPIDLWWHHAVSVWLKVQHIFNSGKQFPYLLYPHCVHPIAWSLFSSHPTPTLLSLPFSPSLLPTDMSTFTKYCSTTCQILTLTITGKGKTNESQQTKGNGGPGDMMQEQSIRP